MSAVLVAVGVWLVAREYAKPKGSINHGSCVQTLRLGISMLLDHAKQHGSFPNSQYDFLNMTKYENANQVFANLEYDASRAVDVHTPPRLIVLKCISKLPAQAGSPSVFCALISGEIVLLKPEDAQLGLICPEHAETLLGPIR